MSVKSILIYIPVLVMVLYFGFGLLLYYYQEKLIFYPTKIRSSYSFSEFPNTIERFFNIDKNTIIHALYFKAKEPRGVVLYFHGNARALDIWGYEAALFTRMGYDVLMPDYRGYGKSTGKISESGLVADAQIIYDDLLHHYDEAQIILYGRSLGTGIACKLATIKQPRLLILETPYLSLNAMAKLMFSVFPTEMILRFHFRNDKNIKHIKCPVHIFHGTADEMIPYRQALKLARITKKEGVLTTIDGGGHNNLSQFEAFQNKLQELLDHSK